MHPSSEIRRVRNEGWSENPQKASMRLRQGERNTGRAQRRGGEDRKLSMRRIKASVEKAKSKKERIQEVFISLRGGWETKNG